MHSIRETKVLFFSLSFPLTFLSLALKRTKPVRGPIIPRHDWICGQTMKAHSALAIPLPRPPFPPYSPPLQPSYRGTVGRRDRRDRIRIDSSTSVTHTRFNSMLPLRQFKSIESIFSLSLACASAYSFFSSLLSISISMINKLYTKIKSKNE